MAALIASIDWSKSPLGPIESWPQSLRTTVSLCLASNFPINIIWGDGHTQIYNDGYRVVCGAVHPRAMGEDYRVTWASAWPAIGQPFERALEGETSYLENQRMFLERNGYPEETFFTFSLSPIRDESGRVVGLFHPVTETTATMLSERRTRALRDIADRAGRATELDQACDLLLKTLGDYSFDLPFAALYLAPSDGTKVQLRGVRGVAAGSPLAPLEIVLTDDFAETGWPLLRAAQNDRIDVIADVKRRRGEAVAGPYPEPIHQACVLPIRVAGVSAPLGFLIVAVSPRLPFNDGYRAFMEMLGGAASTALGNARAYEAERRRAESLAEIDRAKTAFFSNVSHEFRTPLTLLLGPIEDILAGVRGELPKAVRTELDVVHRNALRLLNLVNALLDFSRIEAGRAQALFEATDLSTLTRELASAFQSTIERAGLKLILAIEPLTEAVHVDRDMWEKIVLNLISNAFKFTQTGEIRVGLRRDGDHVELSVRDTGIGIPEQDLGRVFQRFQRVQGARGRTHEGSGIGLALVQDLTKLLGGSVKAQSTVGEGSTFFVRIPLGAAHLEEKAITAEGPQRQQTMRTEAFVQEALRWLPEENASSDANAERVKQPSTRPPKTEHEPRRRILLADDNADMRQYICRLLQDRYDVTWVTNGAEALEAAQASRPDLVLSDVMMPVMDGIELVQRLRADESLRTIPVILLSARAGEEATASGLELGADDYLTKPFAARELLARVQSQLTMASLRSMAAEQEARVTTLAEQQDWLEAVLNRLPVPLLLVEPNTGRFTFWNRAAEKLAGGPFPVDIEGAERGQGFTLTDEHDRPLDVEQTPGSRVRRGETLHDVEVVWHSAAGRFTILVDSDVVPAIGQQPSRAIVTFQDVTRLKQIEQELKVLLATRDEFLSIASHELKTPVTSLLLQLQRIERATKPDQGIVPSAGRLATTVRVSLSQVRRLTRLIDDLLDVARIRSGKVDYTFVPSDLVQITRDTLDGLAEQLARANCEVRVEAPPALPGRWDVRRLEQVLTNIVSNALRYAPGTPLEISLTDGDILRLSVRDYGPGVATEQRESIFDRFDRGTASKNAGGLGLGLFISRQFVRAHGGDILVESPADGGVRFVILLPRDGRRHVPASPSDRA